MGRHLPRGAGIGRVLPHRRAAAWMQAIAAVLPSAHVFEGMRALLLQHEFRWNHFWWAAGLDVVYYAVGVVMFRAAVAKARERGSLMQMGE